ncbi:MAG: helix-turn-helix domain-containing protein [Chloroflexi bacterium]|nr:helix-turn-helix domain-containing protein [Chloroflexota bacterium]
MTDTIPITVQELLSLALPGETRVLAGRASLDRPVTWVSSAPSDDDAARLTAGDFAFLLPPYPEEMSQCLCKLAQSGIVGVAVIGELTPAAVAEAERVSEPLLALPPSVNIRRLERTALALLLDRGAGTEQRAAQLYQQLTVLSAENAGLAAMATLIGETTGKATLIQDKRFGILASWYPPDLASLQEAVESWATTPANLPEAFQDRRRAAQREGILEQAVPVDSLTRFVSPIVAKGMARGYLSLIGPQDKLRPFDKSAAERSAAACALEMAKAKAVSDAEKRVRGTFVDAVLAASLTPLEAARSAKRHGYNPDGRHAALVLDWAGKEHPTYRRLETLVHGITKGLEHETLVQARENEVVLFSRLEPRQGIETARRLADSIRRQANAEFPNDPLAIGIGRPADALFGLRDSYRESRQALSMARRLSDPNPMYFGELNVYRLLFQLEYTPELNAFCQEILGKLIEYDHSQGTGWLETLTAYFAHKGNLSQTAEALFIHRNTLLYRMERIRQVSGLDLDNPETRLSVQLALRAYRLLSAREE